jgi:hypothetical protein
MHKRALVVIPVLASMGASSLLSQTRPEQQSHIGATIEIHALEMDWKSLDDAVIDVKFYNGTSRAIGLRLDDPKHDIDFNIVSTSGARVGCDPPPIEGVTLYSGPRVGVEVPAGQTFTYPAHLKKWACPSDLQGNITLSATWNVADFEWPAASSVADQLKSNQVKLSLGEKSQEADGKIVRDELALVDESLRSFERTSDIQKLKEAIIQMKELCFSDTPIPPQDLRPDAAVATEWLSFLHALDVSMLQAARTPPRVPQTIVQPPFPYRLGIDPTEIKEPDLRKQYEQSIAANNAVLAEAIKYGELRTADGQVSAYFHVWAHDRYHAYPGDQELILSEGKRMGLSPERLAAISASMAK